MLYIALLHYPVKNKAGEIVTTSVVNMDIHDIARAAKTYGVQAFFIVNPEEAQKKLAREILRHWQEGYGAIFNQKRKDALMLVRLKDKLSDVIEDIINETGKKPKTVATGASLSGRNLKHSALKKMLKNDKLPYLLIFGTGSGLAPEVTEGADFILEPIEGVEAYNHLAVRSASAVILDRITRD